MQCFTIGAPVTYRNIFAAVVDIGKCVSYKVWGKLLINSQPLTTAELILEMNKYFHPTISIECKCLSMPGLKCTHVRILAEVQQVAVQTVV